MTDSKKINNSETTNKTTIESKPLSYSGVLETMKNHSLTGMGILASYRPLAYASEVGESFRPVIPVGAVRSLYGLSFAYCGADIALKTMDIKKHGYGQDKVITKALDLTVWHGFASMALPAFTIHSIVKYSGKVLKQLPQVKTYPKVGLWTPVFLGLSSIPFIIHPLDDLTTYVMDNTVRHLYKDKLINTTN